MKATQACRTTGAGVESTPSSRQDVFVNTLNTVDAEEEEQQLVEFLMCLKEPVVISSNGVRMYGTRVCIPKRVLPSCG